MLGGLSLFNLWSSGPEVIEDMVVSLWVVLRYVEEGFARQVLHHPDGIRRKNKHVACDVMPWWCETCTITKWDPGSRPREEEKVRFQCAQDGVCFRC